MTNVRSFAAWCWRHRWALGLIVVGGLAIAGYAKGNAAQADQIAAAQTQANFQSDELDRLARIVADQARIIDDNCEANSQTRQAVINAVNQLGADLPVNPDDKSDSANRTRASNAAKDAARAVVADNLAPALCADGKPPDVAPVAPTTTTTTAGTEG